MQQEELISQLSNMQNISQHLSHIALTRPQMPSKTKPRNLVDEYKEKFLSRINEQRVGTKYKPYTMRALSIRLAQSNVKDVFDMTRFYDDCIGSDNFGRLFFGLTKTKKV